MSSTRTFGIEIEAYNATMQAVRDALAAVGIPCNIESYNHRTPSAWKLVSDASLSGLPNSFELVSPVLSGSEGRETVRKVMDALVSIGVKVNRSCGLHVHMGISELTVKQVRNICKNYVRSETLLDQLMPASRRANNNHFCYGWTDKTVSELFREMDAAQEIDGIAKVLKFEPYYGETRADRYCKVNLTAFARQGTIEFRQHAGTVNAQKAIAWIDLLDAMIEKSLTIKSISAESEFSANP